ncbi:arginase [Formosa sediminum]|uniref:Arginase n=1 Tax=Formosa sediminum TaxID=2594004 RepID=A0A516GT95_9FLAO|nr:arginase family protein [Formosa sediminum]QDO94746.1 arginase [Formosa sediminum]
MDKLNVFTSKDLSKLLDIRSSETKFGQHIKLLPASCTNIYEYINALDVDYIIIGLPEYNNLLTHLSYQNTTYTWDATLKSLINFKINTYLIPHRVLILGSLNFDKELNKVKTLDLTIDKQLAKAKKHIAKINKEITHIIYTLKKSGKTPIIVGGTQNNAYGIIKGCALALNTPINTLNLSAHTKFKPKKGKHNGNGFIYAYAEGFLKHYFVFGLHEQTISNSILKTIQKMKQIHVSTYESIEVKQTTTFKKELKKVKQTISGSPFGIQIDCNIINSCKADNTEGFSLKKIKKFIHYFGKRKGVHYLHISTTDSSINYSNHKGEFITTFIINFMNAHTK